MNDLFLLEPEYRYRAERARQGVKPVRHRKWLRRHHGAGAGVGPNPANDEKNWIN